MKGFNNIILMFSLAGICLSSCEEKQTEYDGGIYTGESINGVPEGYGIWKGENKIYQGFWKKGKRCGQGILTYGDYTYRGAFADNKFNGVGVLSLGDSIVYRGSWKDGKYDGEGIMKDSLNREVEGLWKEDSIMIGTRISSDGVYRGTFNENLIPDGRGMISYGNMQFYEGSWTDGNPDGFGIQLAPDGWLRAGTWKNGTFKGEVLNYTADRIYGIDIARYQHKAPIKWKNLRITSLGRMSKKNIIGEVDYPVSFVYIKCTEGETVRNSYYNGDYKSARSNGIACGAYHFFSIHSEPEKQAQNFLKHLKLNKGDFPPVLDVEPSEKEIRQIGGNAELFRRIRIWLRIVEKSTGMRPILYINQMFVNRHMPYAPDLKENYEVWIARYGEYKPDLHLLFWQLAPDGFVRGIKGHVDINVFNGYRPTYDRYLRKKTYKGDLSGDNR